MSHFSLPVMSMIALGGALGALARYAINVWSLERFGPGFPYGTLLVNVVGALLIGILWVLIIDKGLISEAWRPFIVVGFLGALTTFSTFSLEVVRLLETGNAWMALVYIGLSVVACVALVCLGMWIARIF